MQSQIAEWEGEAPAEPKLVRKTRLGGSLAPPFSITRAITLEPTSAECLKLTMLGFHFYDPARS